MVPFLLYTHHRGNNLAETPGPALAANKHRQPQVATSVSALNRTKDHTNLSSARLQTVLTSKTPRKLKLPRIRGRRLERVLFPGQGAALTDVRLSITRDEPIMDLERCCLFWLHLLPAKNNHMVLREVPNVWKYGPLPHGSQTLMSSSPVEAVAAVQTHHPFKAYLVLSEKYPPSIWESGLLCVLWKSYPSVLPVSFLTTGPKDRLPNVFYSDPREISYTN